MGRRSFNFSREHLALMGKIPDAQLARLAKCSITAVTNRRMTMGVRPYRTRGTSAPTPAIEVQPVIEPKVEVKVEPKVEVQPEPVKVKDVSASVKAALKAATPAVGGMLIPFDQYALLAREFLA